VNLRVTAKWVALALVGLAIAIGVAIAAANLTSQQIGIASESVSAGDTLAPSLRAPEEREDGRQAGHEKPEPGGKPSPTEETSPPSEFTEPEQRSDDYGGGGGGDD
jgi:hypothetical protein